MHIKLFILSLQYKFKTINTMKTAIKNNWIPAIAITIIAIVITMVVIYLVNTPISHLHLN